ncbi:MAG: hypothetical protein PHG06_22245 [Parabacteroides sp.]|nr:hypothetical protein [Parabacteroides sp.]
MKELSLEGRKALYNNFGKSIIEFHSLLPIYLVASDQTEDQINKVILRCGYTILYSIVDISSLLRAEMRETVNIGKRLGLIKLRIAVSEVFKAIVGAVPDDKEALYRQIRSSISSDFADECLAIDKAIDDFKLNYWSQSDQNARNIAEHFSKNPYEYYELIVSANEETEINRVNAILAMIQPLFVIISKIENKEKLLEKIEISEILHYSSSFAAIPEKIEVDSRYSKLGDFMNNEAKSLDSFAYNFNLPNIIEKKLGSFKINETMQYMLQFLELMMHLEFISLETAYSYRAICSSEFPIEQRLNLRLMYKTNHEGFKKLYGFKDDKSETIWCSKIESQIKDYSDVVRAEYESIKFSMKFLAKQTGINDEHLVVVLTHLRKNKNKDYIPKALIELGNLNIREIMVISMLFLNTLKKIIHLGQTILPEIKCKDEEESCRKIDELLKPMNGLVDNSLVDKIKNSIIRDCFCPEK